MRNRLSHAVLHTLATLALSSRPFVCASSARHRTSGSAKSRQKQPAFSTISARCRLSRIRSPGQSEQPETQKSHFLPVNASVRERMRKRGLQAFGAANLPLL
jgi:hypothetical protein